MVDYQVEVAVLVAVEVGSPFCKGSCRVKLVRGGVGWVKFNPRTCSEARYSGEHPLLQHLLQNPLIAGVLCQDHGVLLPTAVRHSKHEGIKVPPRTTRPFLSKVKPQPRSLEDFRGLYLQTLLGSITLLTGSTSTDCYNPLLLLHYQQRLPKPSQQNSWAKGGASMNLPSHPLSWKPCLETNSYAVGDGPFRV
jgi:hypothetical protein